MTKKLMFRELIYYGLPSLPLAMLGLPLFVYLPAFYHQNLGLSLSAVGFALLVARLFDVVTDPLIGILSDRVNFLSKYRWQRKFFIMLGVPILLLGLNFLLKPEPAVGAMYLFTWSLVTYLGWTLINIPWLAWGAEISSNYHEKSTIASSREIFAVVGTVIVITVPVLLSIENNLSQILAIISNVVSVLLPLFILQLLWLLPDTSAKVIDSGLKSQVNTRQKKFSLQQKLKLVSHPAIKCLLPAYFVNSFANALTATLFILFVDHVLDISDHTGSLLMAYFLATIVGFPLWLYIARKTDKHISWSIALMISIAAFVWVPFLDQGNFVGFLIICLISGFALGADVALPASIQGDITQKLNIDNREKNNEIKATGLLFGLWGLLTKLALALAVGIAFPLLENSQLGTDQSNQESTLMLVILYAIVPILLKLWVVFKMWNYPFQKQNFVAVRR